MSGLLAVPSKDHHRFHYIIRLSKPNTSLGCTSAAADSAANFNDELNGQGGQKDRQWMSTRERMSARAHHSAESKIHHSGRHMLKDRQWALSLWWWCDDDGTSGAESSAAAQQRTYLHFDIRSIHDNITSCCPVVGPHHQSGAVTRWEILSNIYSFIDDVLLCCVQSSVGKRGTQEEITVI